jgi:hypothetical protein
MEGQSIHTSANQREKLKRIDMQTALDIASLAGFPTHDTLGNILSVVWCKHSSSVDKGTGVLMETSDLRKILLQQLGVHISTRQDLILESEATGPVVEWIVQFTEEWEEVYRKSVGLKYDISQRIYSAMIEAYQVLEDELVAMYGGSKVNTWKQKYNNPGHANFGYQKGIVRSVFREMETNYQLCRLASKLLQKKEVCNKSGAYSSKVQRNDVQQQVDDAIVTLRAELDRTNSPFHVILQWDDKYINELTLDTTVDAANSATPGIAAGM